MLILLVAFVLPLLLLFAGLLVLYRRTHRVTGQATVFKPAALTPDQLQAEDQLRAIPYDQIPGL